MQRTISILAVLLIAVCAIGQTTKTFTKDITCDKNAKLTVVPKSGYHFVKWSDDVTDNPRTVSNVKTPLTFTAILAANETDFGDDVEILPANPEVGQTITLTATPSDDCLEFEKWSDGNTDNPRTITYNGTVPFTAVYKTKLFNVSADIDEVMGDILITEE